MKLKDEIEKSDVKIAETASLAKQLLDADAMILELQTERDNLHKIKISLENENADHVQRASALKKKTDAEFQTWENKMSLAIEDSESIRKESRFQQEENMKLQTQLESEIAEKSARAKEV